MKLGALIARQLPVLGTVAGLLCVSAARGALAEDYTDEIRPLMARKCYDCHSAEKTKGDLNLERFADLDQVRSEPGLWQLVFERVQAYEMPPKKAGELNYGEFQKMRGFLRNLPKPEQPDCDKLASDGTASYYRGYVMSRRLNRAEYINTLRDLFGVELELDLESLLPADGGGGEGFDTTGDTLFTSSIHIEKYLVATDRVLDTVLPDPLPEQGPAHRAARDRILLGWSDRLNEGTPDAREVIATFARRAWRRPVTETEVEQLMTLFRRAVARGDGFVVSVRLALKGVLISPHFLFLAEPEPAEPGIQRLADVPLASRLSYFIWSSMPDEELLSLAEQGRLADVETYRAQIVRMMKDPRADALGERFALQWLDLDRLGDEVKPDPSAYPEFDPALAETMKAEVTAFFNNLIREDRPLLELLDSDYTFANERLAHLYGLSGIQGGDLRRIELADANRGGLLGMAAVHAVTSYPLRTSPVLRGRWVLESLLGDKIPPPPPGVPALNEESGGSDGLSLRQQLEQHRVQAECAACHDKMDPLGFGLANFDNLGRWRTEMNGQPLDATGTLPTGETYEGPAGLKQVLFERKEKVLRHMIRKMTGFAFGRELNKFDNCVIDDALEALEQSDWRATVLVEAIAMSYPFQHRFHPKHDEPES